MLAIVGTVGLPACYGGFETLVENLVGEAPGEVVVYCSSKAYDRKLSSYYGAKLRYIPLSANGVQSIPYDIISLVDAVLRGANTILLLGVSGALILPFIKLFSSVRVVTNVDGLEWKREKWGRFARYYLKFSERLAVRYSSGIIADNSCIKEYLLREYGAHSSVIEYGGDQCLISPVSNQSSGYALSLCRIEPENNCHLILEAFSKCDVPLKFVGNWNSSRYGEALKNKYSSVRNIEIIDPIYDPQKLFGLRDKCAFYVHGHSAGGTNPSLVEMMFFGKCILCFDCDYNRTTTEGRAKYFKNIDELLWLVSEAKDNVKVGDLLLSLANEKYTWQIIREKYMALIFNDAHR